MPVVESTAMKKLIVLAGLLLMGCPRPHEPKRAPIPEDTNWCSAAESFLKSNDCRDRAGDPMWVNKNGERFKQTCETAQRDGLIFLNPRCIAEAENCKAAKSCPAEGM